MTKKSKARSKTRGNAKVSTDAQALVLTKPEIGKLVFWIGGNVGMFLGWEERSNGDDFAKLVRVRGDGRREVFFTLKSYLYEPCTISDLAHFYRSAMEFHDHSALQDERFDPDIEDLMQPARSSAYSLAHAAVQRIRDLNEPFNVDGASVLTEFEERMGSDVETVRRQRLALAEAKERRRIEMKHPPFCAATYFKKWRELGGNPYVVVHGGRFGIHFSTYRLDHDRVDALHRWARHEDEDRTQQWKYAQSVWNARPASDQPIELQFVPLGA
jgi:hypothetical protein